MDSLTLINARIFTMDAGSAEVSGLVIENGWISQILNGTEGQEPPARGNFLDLGGRIVLPGLIDSHLHLRKYAETLERSTAKQKLKQIVWKSPRESTNPTLPGNGFWDTAGIITAGRKDMGRLLSWIKSHPTIRYI